MWIFLGDFLEACLSLKVLQLLIAKDDLANKNPIPFLCDTKSVTFFTVFFIDCCCVLKSCTQTSYQAFLAPYCLIPADLFNCIFGASSFHLVSNQVLALVWVLTLVLSSGWNGHPWALSMHDQPLGLSSEVFPESPL